MHKSKEMISILNIPAIGMSTYITACRGINGLIYNIGQIRKIIGFLNEAETSHFHDLPYFTLHAVAAGENDLDSGIDVLEHLQYLRTAHAGRELGHYFYSNSGTLIIN